MLQKDKANKGPRPGDYKLLDGITGQATYSSQVTINYNGVVTKYENIDQVFPKKIVARSEDLPKIIRPRDETLPAASDVVNLVWDSTLKAWV